MFSPRLIVTLTAIAVICSSSCKNNNNKQPDKLGSIQFTVTGKEEAQASFKKGLLLLHSFEYEDAAEQFAEAISIDKNFIMAYWGQAMTYNHSLWRFQDNEKAKTVLNQLAATPDERVAKAKTELEKDFIKAVNILYGPGTKAVRDSLYADYMGMLHSKYAGNNEVTAFYSVALIGSVQVGRNTKVYELAAAMAKEVLKNNPNHPGALHYLIHAYDDPQHAALALTTADKYSVIAPSAGHALHMPTHIYLSLGMWDKVISSNINSWEASKNRKEIKKLSNDELGYHYYHWLMYGYLQKGEKEKAKNITDSMLRLCNELSSDRAREHMIYQKSTYLVETNEYGNKLNDVEVKTNDLNIVTRAMNDYTDAMKSYHEKNANGLKEFTDKLGNEILIDEERMNNTGIKLCGSINSNIPNQLDIQQSQIMLVELKAMEARLKKNNALTEKLLKQAVEMEKNVSYAFGPPTIVKPSFELYGEWLLEMNRPKEALTQFNLSLTAAPGRLLSLTGKKNAEAMLSIAGKNASL